VGVVAPSYRASCGNGNPIKARPHVIYNIPFAQPNKKNKKKKKKIRGRCPAKGNGVRAKRVVKIVDPHQRDGGAHAEGEGAGVLDSKRKRD